MSLLLLALSLQAVAPGPAPPAPPTPALPPIIIPEAVRDGDCSTPERRRAIDKALQGFLVEYGPLLRRASQTLQEHQENRQRQLTARGVWTAQDGQRFAMALLERPDFLAYLNDTTRMVEEFGQAIRTITAAGATDEQRCATSVRLARLVQGAPIVAGRGWRAIDAAFAQEARRLGVTLD